MLEGVYKAVIDKCEKKNLFRIIPEFKEIHELFQKMQTASSESNYAYIKQNYSKEWYVVTLDYHVLNWNIDKLKQLIIEYNCKSCKIPIRQLEYQYNAPSRRKIDYYKQSDNYTPIIVVPHMEYLLVVDGNHRLQARIELKKSDINAYFVPVSVYTKALSDDKSKAVCTFTHNLNFLNNICRLKSPMPIFINQSYAMNSFYSEKHNIKLSSFKVIRIIAGI